MRHMQGALFLPRSHTALSPCPAPDRQSAFSIPHRGRLRFLMQQTPRKDAVCRGQCCHVPDSGGKIYGFLKNIVVTFRNIKVS